MSDCFSHAGTQAWKRYTFVIFEGLVFDGFNRNTRPRQSLLPERVIKEARNWQQRLLGRQNFLFGKRLNLWNSGGNYDCLQTERQAYNCKDCHKSAVAGMMLSGAVPVYVKPQFNSSFGIPSIISEKEIEKALQRIQTLSEFT